VRFESRKYVKMRLRPGLPTDPAGGANTAPQAPSWIWGKGWEGRELKGLGRGRDGRGKGEAREERGEGKGRVEEPPQIFCQHDAPDEKTKSSCVIRCTCSCGYII